MESNDTNGRFGFNAETKMKLLQIFQRHESALSSGPTNEPHNSPLAVDPIWQYRMPSLEEFLFDDFFLGRIHAPKNPDLGLYDYWHELLRRVLDPANGIVEVLIQSAVGAGKTTVGLTALLYWLCQALCLRNPQAYSGLDESTTIVFFIFNVTMNRGQNVCFKKLRQMVKRSPFFSQHLISTRARREMTFGKNIVLEVGSQSRHALGEAIKFVLLDESNFGLGSSEPDREAAGQVLENYWTAYQRMVSRFTRPGGAIDGQIWMVSSPLAKNSALNAHIEDARTKNISSTHIIEAPLYQVNSHRRGRPTKKCCGKTFDVLVGDRFLKSHIVAPGETIPNKYRIISVPVDYLDSFKKDIDSSLRDICSIGLDPTCKLIQEPMMITRCVDPMRRSPFSVDTIQLGFDNGDQISDWFDIGYFLKSIEHSLDAEFSIHVDPAVKHDYLGLAMCHIASVDEVSKSGPQRNAGVSGRTVYVNDFTIRVKNVPGQVLPLGKISEFILWLRDRLNVNISVVSCDHFEYEAITQPLRARGMMTKLLSVDRDDKAYQLLRELIYKGGLVLYEYKPLLDELCDLNHFPAQHRVNHPDGGSKDVSDALAGALFNLSQKVANEGQEAGCQFAVVSARELDRRLHKLDLKERIDEFGWPRNT